MLLQLLSQLVDRGLHLRDRGCQPLNSLLQKLYPCLKRPDVGLSLGWDGLPHLLRSGGLVVYTPGLSGTSALAGQCVAQGLRERLP